MPSEDLIFSYITVTFTSIISLFVDIIVLYTLSPTVLALGTLNNK